MPWVVYSVTNVVAKRRYSSWGGPSVAPVCMHLPATPALYLATTGTTTSAHYVQQYLAGDPIRANGFRRRYVHVEGNRHYRRSTTVRYCRAPVARTVVLRQDAFPAKGESYDGGGARFFFLASCYSPLRRFLTGLLMGRVKT